MNINNYHDFIPLPTTREWTKQPDTKHIYPKYATTRERVEWVNDEWRGTMENDGTWPLAWRTKNSSSLSTIFNNFNYTHLHVSLKTLSVAFNWGIFLINSNDFTNKKRWMDIHDAHFVTKRLPTDEHHETNRFLARCRFTYVLFIFFFVFFFSEWQLSCSNWCWCCCCCCGRVVVL